MKEIKYKMKWSFIGFFVLLLGVFFNRFVIHNDVASGFCLGASCVYWFEFWDYFQDYRKEKRESVSRANQMLFSDVQGHGENIDPEHIKSRLGL